MAPMLLASHWMEYTDEDLRCLILRRRSFVVRFRELRAPECILRKAELDLARAETELMRRELKGLVN